MVLAFTFRVGVASAVPIASTIDEADTGFYGISTLWWGAVSFTTDDTAWSVDSIVAPVQQEAWRPENGIFLQVYSDQSGPGLPLGSILTTPIITDTIENQTFTPIGNSALLEPDTTYWIVLGVEGTPTLSGPTPVYRTTGGTPGAGPGVMNPGIWEKNSLGGVPGDWQPDITFATQVQIRMEISGTRIPEPATILLLATGLAALAWRVRRELTQ